jgi:hypothetical protein
VEGGDFPVKPFEASVEDLSNPRAEGSTYASQYSRNNPSTSSGGFISGDSLQQYPNKTGCKKGDKKGEDDEWKERDIVEVEDAPDSCGMAVLITGTLKRMVKCRYFKPFTC